jgi:hypothetical protein
VERPLRSFPAPRASARRAARAAVLAVALACGLGSAPAWSTPITVGGDGGPALEIDPLYFEGWGVFGLRDAADHVLYLAEAPRDFLSAGNAPGMDLEITQALQQLPWQHPQDPAGSENPGTNGGVPSAPTEAVPFVADSIWTVVNKSGRALEDVLLLFTRTVPMDGYPALDVALDANLFSVLAYTSLDTTVRHYGVVPLGDLAPEQSVDFVVRYIVAGSLPVMNDEYVLPKLGVAGLEGATWIPEPGTLLLLGAGLVAIGSRKRR